MNQEESEHNEVDGMKKGAVPMCDRRTSQCQAISNLHPLIKADVPFHSILVLNYIFSVQNHF